MLLWLAALGARSPDAEPGGGTARAGVAGGSQGRGRGGWRRTALRVAARDGDRALFDTVLAQARSTQDTNERVELLSALGAFRDPAL